MTYNSLDKQQLFPRTDFLNYKYNLHEFQFLALLLLWGIEYFEVMHQRREI
jgi:hypothetical protein